MEKNLSTKKSIPTYGQSSGEKIRTDKRIWQAVEITNKETDKKCGYCKEPIEDEFEYWLEQFWCYNCVGVFVHPPSDDWYIMLQTGRCFFDDCGE